MRSGKASRTGWFVAGGLAVLVIGSGVADRIGPDPDPEQVARETWTSVDPQVRGTMCEGMRTMPGTVHQMLAAKEGMEPAVVEATMKILAEEC